MIIFEEEYPVLNQALIEQGWVYCSKLPGFEKANFKYPDFYINSDHELTYSSEDEKGVSYQEVTEAEAIAILRSLQ